MFPPKGTNALVVHEEQDSCFKWPFSPVQDFQWALWKLKGETMVEGGEGKANEAAYSFGMA